VADDLRDEGVTVDLLPPSQVKNLDDYDAVVVGGALYSSRGTGRPASSCGSTPASSGSARRSSFPAAR